jgi:hypothetical protein
MKDTALSEIGRGAAWHVGISVVRHGRGTAWERHGMCELTRHGMTGERHGNRMARVN